MRKIFLDDLPRYRFRKEQMTGIIDWKNCSGYKVRFIYDHVEDYVEIINYEAKEQILTIIYKENLVNISTGHFQRCELGRIVGKFTDKFKTEVGIIFKDENRDMVITDREHRIEYGYNMQKHNKKYYKYTCNKCGWTEGWIIESGLLRGTSCGCCAGKVVVENINSIWHTDKWMIPIINDDEFCKTHTHSCRDRITPTCPDCGRIKDKYLKISNIYISHSIGCTCGDKISYPNKLAYSLLDQLNEIYKFEHLEHEYSPDWIKPKRYDNYFVHNGNAYILEMDGRWHNTDNNLSGQTKEESKHIDNYKDLKATEYGIKVIRIDCEKSELEFIKQNILNSKLSELFNISEIDWLKCTEFALTNLVKITCEYWSSGIHDTKEIANIMQISRQTVIKYLKRGSLVKWCNYDSKLEKRNIKRGKLVEVFKNETSLGIFDSVTDLETKSVEKFGIKLFQGNISSVCMGKWKQYNGFTFKYINNQEHISSQQYKS